ncbi:aspartate kinase [Streptomyces luteoverticillatus]|uniref:Aspartokinase n=1 Tax=Streptomyces luteoverticillatus TaxID=66425 RepID=A0A3S9PQ81_STRLT|nr:aspartate kinase [Streptomyces luteoverticillatus]AZQ74435.1 aspartate kinase [Streptomyces luteoverticillatus]
MLIVQKYGGSSLEDTDRIRSIAGRILEAHRSGHEIVAVCSAMGDTSDELIDLAGRVSGAPPAREMDMLLTAGERVSNALMAMAIRDLGGDARSLSGAQAGIFTDASYGGARIVRVTPVRVRQVLDQGAVALVAGFQGLSRDTDDTTTLGRGGSDVTAVALAAALKADMCEIYTDVDGVFSADPRIVPGARPLAAISSEEMLEMAATGAKVLMPRCVEYARRHGVDIRVRSSFTDRPGTLVSDAVEGAAVEGSYVTGVTHTRSLARIAVAEVADDPAAAAEVLGLLATAGIFVDMVQHIPAGPRSGLVFTVPAGDGPRTVELLERHRERIGCGPTRCDTGMGMVSLVGAAIRSDPGVLATLYRTLAEAGIGVRTVSVSEIRVSVLCLDDRLDDAVRALHRSFGLDAAGEAVVHAGTGR